MIQLLEFQDPGSDGVIGIPGSDGAIGIPGSDGAIGIPGNVKRFI